MRKAPLHWSHTQVLLPREPTLIRSVGFHSAFYHFFIWNLNTSKKDAFALLLSRASMRSVCLRVYVVWCGGATYNCPILPMTWLV